MRNSELDLLLERYYAGETTVAEEKKIREFLEMGSLPEIYHPDREIFKAFASGESIPATSAGFEDSIMARIDIEEGRSRVTMIKRRLYSAVAVAASLLIITSSYFIFAGNQKPSDTFTDPELAYIQTIEVLRFVSDGLNSGTNRMTDLAYIDRAAENIKVLGETNSNVAKQLEPLGYFEKGLKLVGKATGGENSKN